MSKEIDKDKRPKCVVHIFLLAGVLVVCLTGYLYNIYHEFRRDQVSERIVEVPIGAYTFAFPRNAINNISTQKDNSRKAFISLWFILPEMKPATEKNRNRLSVENQLTINLSTSHYGGLLDVKEKGAIDKNFKINTFFKKDYFSEEKVTNGDSFLYPRVGKGERIGDLFLYKKGDVKAAGGDIYTNASDPIIFILECDSESQKFPNPMCSFDAELLGHMSIHYRYPKKYLSQANQIHQFVMSYLQSHFKGVTDHD